MTDIPIVIICHNNYKYVDHTIKQIQNINIDYCKNIIIMNNASNCKKTIEYLNSLTYKIYNNNNNGPWVTRVKNTHIYNMLPDKFILTDPDLEFNKNLPKNFIEILSSLSDIYRCEKIGFALDISDFDKMFQSVYFMNRSIYDWEKQFWVNKVKDPVYELYYAPIDTTFSLINKQSHRNNSIRIAGDFTAKHLPWYKKNKLLNMYENYILSVKKNAVLTTSNVIVSYIKSNYAIINKMKEIFLIENDSKSSNFNFWKNIYTNWENDTFNVFDNFLDKKKIFIDIGGWIGTTSMYGSRNSKHVYCIEADKNSYRELSHNMSLNCENNYTLINKAIFNKDNMNIKFGKNKFLHNSQINDSTSQIYFDNDITNDFCYLIKTITLNTIINQYKINIYDISLIKVDIEGGEENILDDLFEIYKSYNTPLYISFHYSWWNNKDLDRFLFLTTEHKNIIKSNPFISLLFS